MPTELEKKIENLDDVFHKQWAEFNQSAEFIKKALEHETMGNWQHISRILVTCQRRIKVITGDYIRASSYPSMRIINTRMTDVLNVIHPVRDFMNFAIERCQKAQEEERTKKLEEAKNKVLEELELKKLVEMKVKELEDAKPEQSGVLVFKKSEELEYRKLETEIKGSKIDEKPVEIPAPPEENNLLLFEEEEKANEYEGPPRRRAGGLLSCFGR